MSLGLVTEMTKGTEPDPIVEFREGVELLRNEYPEKALVRLRRAFESDKLNPYYLSFLGLSMARAEQKWDQASELCETAVQLKRKEIQFHMNLPEVYALAGLREKALHKLDSALNAHLHCIFSLLSQRSLRKEAASLNPDQVFLRSREDIEPLTPGPVFRSGRSRAEGLRICLPPVFLWQRITGRRIIPLRRQKRSVHGTEPEFL